MNNGKVRIYELSKELHLDNKDILEICNQLNIAVKSHSSTIDRDEAERIRIAAEKYTPSQVGAREHSGTSLEEGSSSSRKPERPKGPNKQQILAVHHKRNNRAPSPKYPEKKPSLSQATSPKLLEKPQVKTPSSTKNAPQIQPPPTDLTPPPTPPARKQPDNIIAPETESVGEQLSQIQPLPKLERETTEEQTLTTASTINSPNPELLSPPVRPKAKTPEKKIEKQPPIKKPEKKTGSNTVTLKTAPTQNKEKPHRSKPEKNKPHKSKPEKTQSEKTVLEPVGKKPEKNKPIKAAAPKLHRPQRLKPTSEPKPPLEEELLLGAKEEPLADEEHLEPDDRELLVEKPKKQQLKLKRPTPPRTSKKQATWEEEEEDLQQKEAKKKAGTKKRRPVIIEDDDDEFGSELDKMSGAAATAVSISIARPPKPKSASKESAGVVASAVKSKKPTPKTERSESRDKRRERKETVPKTPEKIVLPGNLTVRELSELIHVAETEIIKKLFFKGIAVNITQTLDEEIARTVVEELGIEVETAETKSAAIKETEMLDEADLENLQLRPPVVTIMGHVDHGKTTLLDSIRQTKVAQGEAGGITQHIGAYHVDTEHEGEQKQIVFLDTPGHEAFTAMRARGTRVTDIAVLVVAADDGVQPQTKEAISHARAAEVPIIVAINKVDKPESEPDRIKQELTEQNLIPEEWGGETIMVPVSALKGENLDTLLDMILLVADIEELSANPDRLAKGTVIEANLDRARGPVATLLVQNGTLRVGDVIVAGSVLGKIRAMIDDRGDRVEEASPSFAVEILGLNEVPAAGDEFEVFENEKEARAVADKRAEEQRQERLQKALSSRRISLSSISEQAREGELKELNLILKADVQGSVEAILGSLKQLPQNEVQIRVLMAAPGEVTETDVDLAAASGAVIVGFNTTLASGSRAAADREGVDIREYNIIYKLLEDIQGAMEGLLEPEEVEEALGVAQVRAVFTVGRGAVAGCYVQSGKVVRNRLMRVRRGNEVIYQGGLDSLKRIKEDVREVNAGYECGIGASKFNDWQEGDIIEAYEMVFKRRTLSVN